MRQSRPELTQVPATRGRPFQNGNPGRKPGSKNRTTLVAAALLERSQARNAQIFTTEISAWRI
jgi:hypothetical protein